MQGDSRYLITTPRLRLRELATDDLDVVEGVRRDACRLWGLKEPSRAEVAAWLARHVGGYAGNGFDLWGVELRRSGELIGDCGLVQCEIDGRTEIEIGYHLLERHWGHGYATEAARGCVEHALALGITRLVAIILVSNVPSRRVAERLGMSPGPPIEWFGLPHTLWTLELATADDPGADGKEGRGSCG